MGRHNLLPHRVWVGFEPVRTDVKCTNINCALLFTMIDVQRVLFSPVTSNQFDIGILTSCVGLLVFFGGMVLTLIATLYIVVFVNSIMYHRV